MKTRLTPFGLGLFSVCSWFALGLLSVCSWFALGLFSVCSWASRAQGFKGGGGGTFFSMTNIVMSMECDHPTLLALISAGSPKIKITIFSRGAQYFHAKTLDR